jgi:hypothetical protein
MERRECIYGFMGEPEGKRPLSRSKYIGENNITKILKQIIWGGMDCINLAEVRDQWRSDVNTVMKFRCPHNVETSI